MNLYELSSDLIALNDIESVEDLETIREIIKQEIQNKSTGIVAVVRNLESNIAAIDTEIKRLQELKRLKQNNITRLKEYTKECMNIQGIKKLETSLGNISIRKTPASVKILDETKIPLEYLNVKQVTSIDKKTLLDDLKDGLILEGIAELSQGTSLTIK
jgi:hypothetical protein